VDTRGWMGGVSKRAILSIKPETFFRAVSETSLKTSRSLACRCVKGYTPLEGCQDTKTQTTRGFLAKLEPRCYTLRSTTSGRRIDFEARARRR
jgi:hypothetical protein